MTRRRVDSEHLGNSYSPDLNGRQSFAVFTADPDWWSMGDRLPSIMITEETPESLQLEESDALYSDPLGGRFAVLRFPYDAPEPLGETARHLADGYYHEGYLTLCDPIHLGKRIDCFRIAELLYLHAVAHGCERAHVGLGNLYFYDRCEGHYFDAVKLNLLSDAVLDPSVVRRKAYNHFRIGVEAGDIEACYMFGDVLREGAGCDVDFAGALEMYLLSLERCRRLEGTFSVAPGCTHMRLGRAFENGEGCAHDFEHALEHYEAAVDVLEQAVGRFAMRFDSELYYARSGVVRMKQELRM